jgi:outer membrane lipoprotein-sorting protein
VFEQIYRMLLSVENFRAIATVEYHANKGVNVYETVQHGKITGEYRIEVTAPAHVAGSVTASNGQQIFQYNSRVNGRVLLEVQETPERSQVFLTTFIKNYLQSDEISVNVVDMEQELRTVLETPVPGSHPYMAVARLWIDNETLRPVKLVVFDPDDVARMVVTYHVIEFNVMLDAELFRL